MINVSLQDAMKKEEKIEIQLIINCNHLHVDNYIC